MIHIISGCYKPNIAATMRLMALVKGIEASGTDYRLVFAYPNNSFCKVKDERCSDNVCYLWEKHPTKNKVLKFLRSFIDVKHYVTRLPKGSSVVLINASEYLSTVIRYRTRIKVYVESNEYPLLEGLMPSFLQKKFIKACPKVDGMFVISSALKEYYEGIGVNNVTVLNMVVEPTRFQNLCKNENNEKYIAYCGSATNNKDGVDILIKAFAIFSQKHPDYKLYIIGKTPAFSDDQSNLKLVQELGLENNVIFTGELPSQEIPQKLADAEMLVLARPVNIQSKYGFPTKLGEYLLTGNPVVVTAVGDIPLFLEDGETAVIAQPGEAHDFAEKMLWVADHTKEAAQIGMKGREVALKEFNGYIEAKKILLVIGMTE